jgi:hypothetical protein
MPPGTDIPAAIDYAGTGETQEWGADPADGNAAASEHAEPTPLVELVVIDGPEGKKLHAIQAEVIYRVLARLAEKQTQTPQKGSRL